MNVLHYKSNFLNSSETFVKRLIQHHRQYRPAAMCIQKKDYTDSCPVYEKPSGGWSGLYNTLCFHLNWCLPFYTDTIRQFAPDVIHAHFGFDGYRMVKPTRKTGVPLVVSFYGSDVSRLPAEFDWSRRYRMLAKQASAFIAASDLMKEQLIKLGFPPGQISVVRFGLDLQKFNYSEQYSPQKPIMMAGRMVEKKGFSVALEAIKILKDEGFPIELELYGDGTLRSELEQKAKMWKLNSLVTFHGHQPIDNIRRAYRQHSLLLVPSLTASDGDCEGIPNTILEGMACGIPVIATRHSAIPEVITHEKNGLLVDENKPEALARMIQYAHQQKIDLGSLRKNARRHIEEYYDIHRMVQQVEGIYGKVSASE